MTSLPFRPSDGVPPPPPKACSRRSDSRRGRKKKKTRESREGKRVLSFSPQSQLVFPSFSPGTISLAPQHLNVAGKATECAKVLPYPCVLVRRPPTYTVGYRHALLTSERSAWPSTKGDVTRDDSQRRFLVQHSVGMLEQCCNYSEQCRNNVATLCWAKNRARLYRLFDPIKDSRLCHEFLQTFFKKRSLVSFFKES